MQITLMGNDYRVVSNSLLKVFIGSSPVYVPEKGFEAGSFV
jgi:hypothetical protein